jgi:hypothetical protein
LWIGVCVITPGKADEKQDGPKIPRLAAIHRWTKVNPKPLKLPSALNTLCAQASIVSRTVPNPHRNRYFTVYVNRIGKDAMAAAESPQFPVGSLIVKEKLPDQKARKAELLTAMIKREKGYDSEGGDWEYAVLDGAGKKTIERGKLTNCASCHAQQKASDYVFRTYLPVKTTVSGN